MLQFKVLKYRNVTLILGVGDRPFTRFVVNVIILRRFERKNNKKIHG